MSSVDFKTFARISKIVLDARLPVLIRGRHGVGKSEVVYETARSRGLSVVERRASQMTEGDLLGLPDTAERGNGRKATTWNAPDWLVTACEKAVVLFLDEVDRATLEVRQGLFELTDSRKINGWALHPQTLIIAAVNGGEHGSQYQVGEMDPAELDRWTVFDIEPTVEDWLTWAKNHVHQLVWDFINHNHAHLEHKDDFEPNKVYPSRRSVKRFSDAGNGAAIFEAGACDIMQYHLASSFLGFEAAAAFRDYAQNYSFAVTVEDIIDNGDFSKTTHWKINDQLAMVEKISASGRLDKEISDTAVKNIVGFFHLLEGEVAMKFHTIICNLSDDSLNGKGSLIMRLHDGVRDRLLNLIGSS